MFRVESQIKRKQNVFETNDWLHCCVYNVWFNFTLAGPGAVVWAVIFHEGNLPIIKHA